MLLACVSVLAAVHAVHARPALSVQLADGGVFDASDVLFVFGNLSRAQALRLQGPSGGSYALQEKRGLLGSLDLLPTSDTGDVACQGSLNTERLVMVGDDQSLQLARKWLLTVPLDATLCVRVCVVLDVRRSQDAPERKVSVRFKSRSRLHRDLHSGTLFFDHLV
eukprot:COSAG03_NODE_1810_length_3483_cov_1.786643_1_plen_165_part_00